MQLSVLGESLRGHNDAFTLSDANFSLEWMTNTTIMTMRLLPIDRFQNTAACVRAWVPELRYKQYVRLPVKDES
jgi:hypothetical protein